MKLDMTEIGESIGSAIWFYERDLIEYSTLQKMIFVLCTDTILFSIENSVKSALDNYLLTWSSNRVNIN